MDEQLAAREYWRSIGRDPFYDSSQHWRTFIAQRVARHQPRHVLEFGCNAGRNLFEVRSLLPYVELTGVDVNEEAVTYGAAKYGLQLHAAGEEYLAGLEDRSVDVVFTVSVLDHLPAVEQTFKELARVTNKALVLLEPYIGRDARVDQPDGDGATEAGLTRVPYTYAWDYLTLSQQLGDGWRWTWSPYPLSSENMGPFYWLIEGCRVDAATR